MPHRVASIMRVTCLLVLLARSGQSVLAGESSAETDPWWILVHEPAVLAELKLDQSQRQSLNRDLGRLDLRFLPLRNQKPADALAAWKPIAVDLESIVDGQLKPTQRQRLEQIRIWRVGVAALKDDDVAQRMGLSESQRSKIGKVIDDTAEAVIRMQKANEDSAPDQLQAKYVALKTEEQKKIQKLLSSDQLQTWATLHGPDFDLKALGHTRFLAPDLVDTGQWVNSSPLSSGELRGKVVVVHFYAFGCINCIHNFPAYRDWQDRYAGKDVALIGIHTPETSDERNIDSVQREAAKEKLRFPILIDDKSQNWNAWGNSMWPCVYLIDREGYLRHYWSGELNWQGATGQKQMTQWIDEMLAEKSAGESKESVR